MTPRAAGSSPVSGLPAVLLAVAGVFLLWRAWGAVGGALSPASTAANAASTAPVPIVAKARMLDAGLATVDLRGRDPLNRKYVPPPPGQRAAEPAPEPAPPPQLRLLLYDEIQPVVKIAVEGELSPRLTVGQSFKGWRVESISSTRVVVSKDGETISLTS